MTDSSRRDFFKYMAVLGLVTFSTTPLEAKAAKDLLMYQDTPKDGKKCIDCVYFIPESSECKIVEGSIDPEGWCKIFFSKKRSK